MFFESDSEFEFGEPGHTDDYAAEEPQSIKDFAGSGRGSSAQPVGPNSFMSELYAAAWAMAQRDHEIDRLFNPEFYQAGDI